MKYDLIVRYAGQEHIFKDLEMDGEELVDESYQIGVDENNERCELDFHNHVQLVVKRKPTKAERIKALDEQHKGKYDTALPQPWAENVLKRTNIWPVGHLVWLYDEMSPSFGRPFPVDEVGDDLINRYPHLFFPTSG